MNFSHAVSEAEDESRGDPEVVLCVGGAVGQLHPDPGELEGSQIKMPFQLPVDTEACLHGEGGCRAGSSGAVGEEAVEALDPTDQ